jgi:hypothetical protein
MHLPSRRRAAPAFTVAVALVCGGGTRAGSIPCAEADLLRAVAKASGGKGGTIAFDCRDTTIRMTRGLGEIGDDVVIDGEDRNLTLEFVADFHGCQPGGNGIGAPPAGRMRGRRSVVRGLTFRNFLESIQIWGRGNTIEGCTFLAHACSDDAVSIVDVKAVDSMIRGNRFEGYDNKAIQMSFGGGTIQGNRFVDSMEPIRAPYDNRAGAPFLILDNAFTTRGSRDGCAGIRIDGRYRVHFERNEVKCKRGLRVGGNTEILVRDNLIEGNPRGGVQVRGHAVASLEGNRILGNGLDPGSEPAAGVVVWEAGVADLGGGTLSIGGETVRSRGGNVLRGNGVADVRNLRADFLVPAENNCWDGATGAAIRGDVEGSVDFTPFSSPAAAEVCDGIDNDCDGEIDDRCVEPETGRYRFSRRLTGAPGTDRIGPAASGGPAAQSE